MGHGGFGVHVRRWRCWRSTISFCRRWACSPLPTRRTGSRSSSFCWCSITGSQLSSRIRLEADEANQRRREVERLYRFSRKLLGEGNVIQLMNAIPNYIVESFEAGAAELFLPQKDKFYRSGFGDAQLDEEKMKTAFRPRRDHDGSLRLASISFRSAWVCDPIGSLGISGSTLSRQSVEAVSTLVAIAIERARAVEQLGQTEAERQGERLKSALLDSITHDFRTPLTSMKAAVSSLLSVGKYRAGAEAGTADHHRRRVRPPESPR